GTQANHVRLAHSLVTLSEAKGLNWQILCSAAQKQNLPKGRGGSPSRPRRGEWLFTPAFFVRMAHATISASPIHVPCHPFRLSFSRPRAFASSFRIHRSSLLKRHPWLPAPGVPLTAYPISR